MTASLFDPDVMLDTVTVGAYRASEPATSREAAEGVRGLNVQLRRCLAALAASDDGLTDDALFAAVQCPTIADRYVAATRRGSLRTMGLVEDSGRVGKSRKGKKATIWQVTAEGREVAARMGES